MLEKVVLVESDILTTLALVSVLAVGGNVGLVLLDVVALEVTLGTFQFL